VASAGLSVVNTASNKLTPPAAAAAAAATDLELLQGASALNTEGSGSGKSTVLNRVVIDNQGKDHCWLAVLLQALKDRGQFNRGLQPVRRTGHLVWGPVLQKLEEMRAEERSGHGDM
jgi:hypothetical protein